MKEFIRYSNGRAVPGTLVYREFKPRSGNYKEIVPGGCCNSNLDGEWFFLDVYEPPFAQGLLDFPNHAISMSSANPNLVGIDGPSEVMLYINTKDSNGNFYPFLAGIAGNSGILTLTQGTNSVTYAFDTGAFTFDGNMVIYDTIFGGSTPGSIVVTSPSAGDFNVFQPIIINIST